MEPTHPIGECITNSREADDEASEMDGSTLISRSSFSEPGED